MAGAPAANTYQDVNLPMSQAPAMAQPQPQPVAAMPQAIPNPMPQQELNDLVAYLESLR